MGIKIPVCGKGGSGKSMLASLLANAAQARGLVLRHWWLIRMNPMSVDFVDDHTVVLEKEGKGGNQYFIG